MTKLQSLVRDKNRLIPVEIELTLWPGLPGIQFLGLPDQHLKESTVRIKSAIKQAGFQFPQAQQILVNLRPSHLKKTSRGLELAVACAYLKETEQINPEINFEALCIYGELTLEGQIIEPDDVLELPSGISSMLTGDNRQNDAVNFSRCMIHNLQDLAGPLAEIKVQPADAKNLKAKRPELALEQKYSAEQAKLISILAVGEHSALLAGAAGSGKTTLAKALSSFLREPDENEFLSLKKIHREFGGSLEWRPVVKPHHSTPIMAMIGGGAVPFAGEISRAHGGILILDELLEFSSTVQESLREPFEEGKMRVYRAGKLVEYPAKAQIIATTNLCPCGDWTPQMKNPHCRYSMTKCQSYSSRLSGPLVDRFDILFFHQGIGKIEVSGGEIFRNVQRAQEFSKSWKRESLDLQIYLSETAKKIYLDGDCHSQRRKNAVLKVARTIADLALSRKIETHHLKEALGFASQSFERLRRWS